MIDEQEPSIALTETLADLLPGDLDLRRSPPGTGRPLRTARIAATGVACRAITGQCFDLSVASGAALDQRLFRDPVVCLAGVVGEAVAVNFRRHEIVLGSDRSISKAWNLVQGRGRAKLDRFADALAEARELVIEHWPVIEAVAGALMDRGRVPAWLVVEIVDGRAERADEWREIFRASVAHVTKPRPIARVVPLQKKVGS